MAPNFKAAGCKNLGKRCSAPFDSKRRVLPRNHKKKDTVSVSFFLSAASVLSISCFKYKLMLYFYVNDLIEKSGYLNLDFNGNLGHTINRHKFQRKYIEKGNKKKISCADYFTFEPHISIPKSKFGFKKENIYIFKNNELVLL